MAQVHLFPQLGRIKCINNTVSATIIGLVQGKWCRNPGIPNVSWGGTPWFKVYTVDCSVNHSNLTFLLDHWGENCRFVHERQWDIGHLAAVPLRPKIDSLRSPATWAGHMERGCAPEVFVCSYVVFMWACLIRFFRSRDCCGFGEGRILEKAFRGIFTCRYETTTQRIHANAASWGTTTFPWDPFDWNAHIQVDSWIAVWLRTFCTKCYLDLTLVSLVIVNSWFSVPWLRRNQFSH